MNKPKHGAKQGAAITAALVFVCLSALIFALHTGALRPGSEKTESAPESVMTAYFLDVGSADCSLFVNGNNALVIDAGQDGNRAASLLTRLRKENCPEDTLQVTCVITHPHADHVNGFSKLIGDSGTPQSAYRVTAIYTSVLPEGGAPGEDSSTGENERGESTAYQRLIARAEEKGIPVAVPEDRAELTIGGMRVSLYLPKVRAASLNDRSIVTRVQFGDTVMLVAGDAEAKEEKALLDGNYPVKADLLRVAHHGSDTGTGEKWLTRVHPVWAVISVGADDPYQNPDPNVLDRLSRAHCTLWQTRYDGTVVAVSNGKSLTVTGEKPAEAQETGPFVGNRRPGSMKLHKAGSACVETMAEKNKKYFSSAESALSEGYVPCKVCFPDGLTP